MSNPAVLTQFGAPDPNASPLNIVQLVTLLNQLVSSQIQGSYIPYIIQNATPNVDDQDKAWIYIDSSGRPIETRIYYNGAWRRIYNGMIGEIRIFSGDPTDTTTWNSAGLGVAGGTYDGWHICNGQDGTPDLSNLFIAGAEMDSGNGYTGGQWKTKLEGTYKNTGGIGSVTLNQDNTYRPAVPGFKVDRYTADGNTNSGTGDLYGVDSVQHIVVVPADPGNPTPDGIDIINPYVAMGYIIFVGYSA